MTYKRKNIQFLIAFVVIFLGGCTSNRFDYGNQLPVNEKKSYLVGAFRLSSSATDGANSLAISCRGKGDPLLVRIDNLYTYEKIRVIAIDPGFCKLSELVAFSYFHPFGESKFQALLDPKFHEETNFEAGKLYYVGHFDVIRNEHSTTLFNVEHIVLKENLVKEFVAERYPNFSEMNIINVYESGE